MIINFIQNKEEVVTSENIQHVDKIIDDSRFYESIWFWLLIIAFIIILCLAIKIRKEQTKFDYNGVTRDNLKKAKSVSIDMDNLMNSINNSKELYKELSRVCHPDRFINSDKQELAEKIFQEVSNNKRDFKKLFNEYFKC